MSSSKIVNLAQKFATKLKTVDYPSDRVEDFYWDTRTELVKVVSELESDLLYLKVRDLTREPIFKAMAKIREEVLKLAHGIDIRYPYPGAATFVDWVASNNSLLMKAHELTNKYLKPTPDIPAHTAKGIPMLLMVAENIKGHLANVRSEKATFRPPRMS